MSKRTNDFQELITLLVQTLGEDRATPSAMVKSKVPGVRKREVDIRVEAEVDGLPVYIGIEVSASKSRPKSVEWVERMYGKHDHLYTTPKQLVLVSSSGFTKGALKLAEHYGIKAITPGGVTPDFVGEIINNLTSLGLEVLTFTAEKVKLAVDPPFVDPGLPFEVGPDIWASMTVHHADSTPLCSVADVVTLLVRNRIDLSQQKASQDGEQKQFTLTQPGPIVISGGPIFLIADVDSESPKTLRRITLVEIDGKLDVRGTEMPLKHGHFDGTNYSNATAELEDLRFDWVVTEGEDGKRIGSRVAPVNDPLSAQTYRSEGEKRMVRVPEGNSEM